MNTACVVLLVELDFILQLIVTNSQYEIGAKDAFRPNQIVAFVAVNEDADTFLAAPDYDTWVVRGDLAVLPTKGRTPERKDALRKNFIEKQIAALKTNFYTHELSMKPYEASLFEKIKVSLFGYQWGKAWKADAQEAAARIGAPTNPAFNFLLNSNAAAVKAHLGILYLAHKYGFDAPTAYAAEQAGLRKIVKPEDGPTVYLGERATPTLARFGLHNNPAPRPAPQSGTNIFDQGLKGNIFELPRKKNLF